MPIQPSLLERLLFFQLKLAPSPILDLAGALAYQALSVAAELDLFRALHQKPMTPTDLAAHLEIHERGARTLLQALEATGYVEERNGSYNNSAGTKKWLVGDDSIDITSAAYYWSAAITDLWPQAAGVIRTGRRAYNFYDWVEARPDLSAAFQRLNLTGAELVGNVIAGKLDLPASASRLLDVGGGHGMFSVILCQHYPNLKAKVLDSAAALTTAREIVAQHELSDRIELFEGDLWQVQWGQDYDCILLFNLLHHFDLDTNKKMLKVAARALKPGGCVAILDQIEGKVNGAAAKAFVRLTALQYYLFADGRVYSIGEIRGLLTECGFSKPRFHSLTKAPGSALVVATKES